MAEVVANGLRFHVQRLTPPASAAAPSGGRETVVFLHGLVMDDLSSFYYTLANPCAAAGFDVVAYDLRGHGRSERPASGYTVDDSVDDLLALLDALGVAGPVHMVGNSFGGTVALAFALRRPDLVSDLMLIEAAIAVEGWGEQVRGTLWSLAFGIEREEAAALVEEAGRKGRKLAEKADRLVNHTTLLDDLLAVVPVSPTALRSLPCPVFGVYGGGSDIVARAQEAAKHVPNFVIDVVVGRGHSILVEEPSYLRGRLLSWLSGERCVAGPAVEPQSAS